MGGKIIYNQMQWLILHCLQNWIYSFRFFKIKCSIPPPPAGLANNKTSLSLFAASQTSYILSNLFNIIIMWTQEMEQMWK